MEKQDQYLLNIAKLPETAQKEGWIMEYDPDLDSLYWTRPVLSEDARLAKLTNEYALYMTPAGEVEGVFIEYAKNNFLAHNADLSPIVENLTIEDDNAMLTLPQDAKERVSGLLELLGDKIANETVRVAMQNKVDLTQILPA